MSMQTKKLHEDTRRSIYQDFAARADSLMVKFNGACAYFKPEILSIPEEKLSQFFKGRERAFWSTARCLIIFFVRRSIFYQRRWKELLSKTMEFSNTADDVFFYV